MNFISSASKDDFLKSLKKHNLTVNKFLDLKEMWERLPATDRCQILKDEIKSDQSKKGFYC